MKVSLFRFLRSASMPLVGIVALGLVGCGGKESDPDAVDVTKLKSPYGLRIDDEGNGAVTLHWTAANNEENFDGYNVYGIKADDDLSALKNEVLKLLDKEGEPVSEAKSVLQKFNYNGSDLETAGSKMDADADFEYYPIHKTAGDTPLLPTCKNINGTCTATSEENQELKGDQVSLNGETSYKVTGLKPGSEYCFLVLSSMDGGTTVSATSSEIRCVKPKFKATITLTVGEANPSDNARLGISLADILAACKAGSCPTLNSEDVDGTMLVAATDQAGAATPESLNYEDFKTETTGVVYLTAGENSAIKQVGYKSGGFTDTTMPNEITSLTEWSDDLENEGGYTISGASLPVSPKYVYVVAVGNDAHTSFDYYWLWVKSEKTAVGRGLETTLELMLPGMTDDLSLGAIK